MASSAGRSPPLPLTVSPPHTPPPAGGWSPPPARGRRRGTSARRLPLPLRRLLRSRPAAAAAAAVAALTTLAAVACVAYNAGGRAVAAAGVAGPAAPPAVAVDRVAAADGGAGGAPPGGRPLRLFIAVGSAPAHGALRAAARDGWLGWRGADVAYRFFSDARPAGGGGGGGGGDAAAWDALDEEAAAARDIVRMPLTGGYGSANDNAFGARGLWQMRWALRAMPPFDYYLRVDDDSFLCLHKLRGELGGYPPTQFVAGRYWCRPGRFRMDENYLLFSRDLVEVLGGGGGSGGGAPALVGGLLPFDPHVTLGWNVGYWAAVLNVTVLDDQARIDAQQGELTTYMHAPDVAADPAVYAPFCERYVYAHHVSAAVMAAAAAATRLHAVYSEVAVGAGGVRCPPSAGRPTFLASRHSKLLPNVEVTQL